MTTVFTLKDLEQRREQLTSSVICDCELVTASVGGQPASDEGVRAFVIHHLGLANPDEIELAIARILNEEVGERDVTPENGEFQQKEVYQVNVVRKTEHGPYLGDWMIKACIKNAASRLGVFQQLRGSKGDVAETGQIIAHGNSLRGALNHVYFYDMPRPLSFERFLGKVQTPKGPQSIMHHSECVATGSKFSFEFRFLPTVIKADDIRDILSMMGIVGIGSCRSLEHGKFAINQATFISAEQTRKKEKKDMAA